MSVQAKWNWKTHKSCWLKHHEIEQLKNDAGSSTIKLKNLKVIILQAQWSWTNSKTMLLQEPWNWKTQKRHSLKHRQVRKLKNHAGSSTVKLKNSNIMLVQAQWNWKKSQIMLVHAPWNWKTQKPCWLKHCEIEKFKNCAGSSAIKLKNWKIMLVQTLLSWKTQKP